MSSPLKKLPEDVADCVLRRATVSKIARRLQNRLALAQFKTKHGWEDLTLDVIEPKVEEEMRRKRLYDGDFLSDTSSSASDLPYPTKTLMSSPLKAPLFSDAVGSSNGSSGHRKRTYVTSVETECSSPIKRYRTSPPARRSFDVSQPSWKAPTNQPVVQPSPAKHRRQQHFTTSAGPDVSFFPQRRPQSAFVTSHNFAAAASDDDDALLPAHSFTTSSIPRTSPPRTPPMQTRTLLGKRSKSSHGAVGGGSNGSGGRAGGGGPIRGPSGGGSGPVAAHGGGVGGAGTGDSGVGGEGRGPAGIAGVGCRPGEEGADLLLYLATSPSPAVKANRILPDRPSTPPPKNSKLDLPSSMMTTPGGGTLFPTTPGQAFDFADFVNITPSPAQKAWRTPGGPLSVSRTDPLNVARKRLTFDEPLV